MAWGALAPMAETTGETAAETTGETMAETTGEDKIIEAHGYSYFGDLKYPADFPHYDYVNPNAPKGGNIVLSAAGGFDSLNPYSRKGRADAYSSMMYESLLAEVPLDEPSERYGLLAHRLEYDPGKTWVIFYMRPEARFSDGTPLTAHDVVFSHNLLLEQGLPSYGEAVRKRVLSAEALDDHRVRFTFAPGISRRSLISQVGSVPVWSQKWFEQSGARLDEPRLETSPGSGPYVLDSYEVNRYIVYRRNPEYWGRDLPINLGRHNFDEIRVEYFADATAQFEAFKAGEYSFRLEPIAKNWATGYDFPNVQRGLVVRETLPNGEPPLPLGFIFNLGKPHLQDRRVREAIALGFNFEWTNESLLYGLYNRRDSFVQGTPHEADAPPEGAELAFLQSLGDLVPPEMLTAPALRGHRSSAERQIARADLRRAAQLLDAAGWTIDDDSMRRNAEGALLSLSIPVSSSFSDSTTAAINVFAQNLQRMGIDAQPERVDPAQYTSRRRDRDYDMIYHYYETFLAAGTGLRQMYGSGEAAFSVFNPAGLASPLVDTIIDRALISQTPEEERIMLMALDRALRYERIMIPLWYRSVHWVAYYDQYAHPAPERLPPYGLGVLDFWWYDQQKAAALRAAGVLR
ncbi:MAG: ABC transporter substrate-binding protein [Rhodobacteraceae bacterium]|nr:ABC transporter substrate-binding protein [Paracoccaceae bacterium]